MMTTQTKGTFILNPRVIKNMCPQMSRIARYKIGDGEISV